MAISYPLAMPGTPGFVTIKFKPVTIVGATQSPYTMQGQQFVWPGQGWAVDVTLPPMHDAAAGAWIAWLLGLNGQQGTFSLGDSVRRTPLGTIAGSPTVNSGAAANSTTLPITGGTGAFAVGDWLQVGTNLHRVVQVNAGSVDVFPRLRSAYTNGTAITYNSAKGLFRLASNDMSWDADVMKIFGIQFSAVEAL